MRGHTLTGMWIDEAQRFPEIDYPRLDYSAWTPEAEAMQDWIMREIDSVPSEEVIRDAIGLNPNTYTWSAEVSEWADQFQDYIAQEIRKKWKAQERWDRQVAFLLWGVHL